mmetsp:Transcript_22273/g.28559  ORF Transcript_22273/g.28559 Transcript_22273/m.28559 type:complete len:103 (-) Transcript_22273:374-682(-)
MVCIAITTTIKVDAGLLLFSFLLNPSSLNICVSPSEGEVDLFEFLRFMLSSMEKVDKELMDDLKDLFESLDETRSNSIQKEDLILIAQNKKDPWSLRRERMQ